MIELRRGLPGIPDGALNCHQAWEAGLEVLPDLDLSEWADRYRQLSGRMEEAGRYETRRTPYMREIMNALSMHSPYERVVFKKGSRMGASEAGNNWIGYSMHYAKVPIVLVEPRAQDARKEARQRIDPMIAATDVLRDLVMARPEGRSGNLIDLKIYPGGFLAITSAGAGANARRFSTCNLFLDEIDAWHKYTKNEGSIIELFWRRTNTFKGRRKMYLTSSPTTLEESLIEQEYKLTDQQVFEVPCRCGDFQPIIWSQIIWPKGEPDKAAFQCRSCQALIQESHKEELLLAGRWVPTAIGKPRRIGFFASALYSPSEWLTWADAAHEKLAADEEGEEALQVFTNTVLGECYQLKGKELDYQALLGHQHEYKAQVPSGVLVLTCGVDVHEDRLELEVVGWGSGWQSWGIEYRVIQGDPRKKSTWDELDEVLRETWQHEDGFTMSISVTCIDSGGHRTNEVYNYCGPRKYRRIFAIKGSRNTDAPVVDPPKRKKSIKGRRQYFDLWWVGDAQSTAIVYGQFAVEEPGPGYCHWPTDQSYGASYFQQLTSMTGVTKHRRGIPYVEWQLKAGRRNEAVDCRRYALAALYMDDPNWKRKERRHARRVEAAANRRSRQKANPDAPPSQEGPREPPSPPVPADRQVPGAPPPPPTPAKTKRVKVQRRNRGTWNTGRLPW